MKSLPHISPWLATGICIALLVQAGIASRAVPRQDAPKDTLKARIESDTTPGGGKTYKLLPKYYQGKDTAGFRLIPKDYDDAVFVQYDIEPQIVKRVEPAYPDSVLGSGLEGRVIVKMWVDTVGKVERAVVLKSDAEVFNEPAIKAAKQFVFTPAYMKDRPVAVWVSYPFRFQSPNKK